MHFWMALVLFFSYKYYRHAHIKIENTQCLNQKSCTFVMICSIFLLQFFRLPLGGRLSSRASYWTVARRGRPRGSYCLIDVEEEHKIGLQDGGPWTLAQRPLELLCVNVRIRHYAFSCFKL